MSEALDRLQAEKEKAERELAQTQHKIQRLENLKQYYEKGVRRARSHRLITRGAAVESIAPEAKGIRTDKGDLNRWIRATNSMIRKAKERAAELTGKLKDLIAKMREPQSPNLAALLGQYYSIRNAGAYSDKAKAGNLKRYSEDFGFLQSKGLFSVEQLHDYVSELSGKLYDMNAASRKKSGRMKKLKELLRLADDYNRLKPICDGIPPKGGFGKKCEKYMAEHESEISQYHAVRRKLDNLLPEKKFATKAWKSELDRLADKYAAMGREISAINADLKKLWKIQSNMDNTLRQQEQISDHRKHRTTNIEI